MDADSFEEGFRLLVAEPALAAGFERWGKGLWFERDGLRAAVLRTELRHQWPFRLTLVAGHDCLRDFDDQRPPPRSRNPSEYPVKIRPSDAASLVRRYRYTPYNLGRWPSDEMDDRDLEGQLRAIGSALANAAPMLADRLTPRVVLDELLARGEEAWVEQRWIEDYRTYLRASDGAGDDRSG